MTLATVNVISERRRVIPRPTRPPQPWMNPQAPQPKREAHRSSLHKPPGQASMPPRQYDNRSARFSFDERRRQRRRASHRNRAAPDVRRVHATCRHLYFLPDMGRITRDCARAQKSSLRRLQRWRQTVGNRARIVFSTTIRRFPTAQPPSSGAPCRCLSSCRRILMLRAKVEAMGCARQRAGEAMVLRR